jgi:energy-coupling factor transporter ATP-binding protein EcfA2
MRFSKLRIAGFKSFVEPMEFIIGNGLTGVVGPNGCGKSNLVEALRWVMGENSYKNMRASGMDDVIFSGSLNRPARNTAEVTLFLENNDRTARPPSMMPIFWRSAVGLSGSRAPTTRSMPRMCGPATSSSCLQTPPRARAHPRWSGRGRLAS